MIILCNQPVFFAHMSANHCIVAYNAGEQSGSGGLPPLRKDDEYSRHEGT
jgi:hypothetical protein